MAFVMRITNQGFTTERYNEVLRRLEAAGEGAPAGRLFHVSFGDTENLTVSDIWDTRANFDRFFGVVGPIMQELGVTAGEPEFYNIHNYISGIQAGSAAG